MKLYGEKFLLRDPQKTKQVFQEYFIQNLVILVKLSTFFEHKEKLIEILYYFCHDTPEDRIDIINRYKEKLKDDQLFLQSLVVLVKLEIAPENGES